MAPAELPTPAISIYLDADACPVKEEAYRVAARYALPVFVVSNAWMQTPDKGRVTSIVVGDGFDEADDWIVERVGATDIVVTEDIPLAARCLDRGAAVLSSKGRIFSRDSIGSALAGRELLALLRESGQSTGGPSPLAPKDRSQFLSSLDEIVQRLRRRR